MAYAAAFAILFAFVGTSSSTTSISSFVTGSSFTAGFFDGLAFFVGGGAPSVTVISARPSPLISISALTPFRPFLVGTTCITLPASTASSPSSPSPSFSTSDNSTASPSGVD